MYKRNKRFRHLIIVTGLFIVGHAVAVYTNYLIVAAWLRNITYVLTLGIVLLLIARWLQVNFGFFDAGKWKRF